MTVCVRFPFSTRASWARTLSLGGSWQFVFPSRRLDPSVGGDKGSASSLTGETIDFVEG